MIYKKVFVKFVMLNEEGVTVQENDNLLMIYIKTKEHLEGIKMLLSQYLETVNNVDRQCLVGFISKVYDKFDFADNDLSLFIGSRDPRNMDHLKDMSKKSVGLVGDVVYDQVYVVEDISDHGFMVEG